MLLFRDRLVQRAEILTVDHAVRRDLRAVLFEDVFCVGFAVQMLVDQVCILAAENEFQLVTHQCVFIADLCLEAILRQLFNAVEDIVQRLTLRRTDHCLEFCKLSACLQFLKGLRQFVDPRKILHVGQHAVQLRRDGIAAGELRVEPFRCVEFFLDFLHPLLCCRQIQNGCSLLILVVHER